MTGLHRMAATVLCWGLSMIALLAGTSPYIPTVAPGTEWWLRMLLIVGIAAGILVAAFVILLFWTYFWFRRLH